MSDPHIPVDLALAISAAIAVETDYWTGVLEPSDAATMKTVYRTKNDEAGLIGVDIVFTPRGRTSQITVAHVSLARVVSLIPVEDGKSIVITRNPITPKREKVA